MAIEQNCRACRAGNHQNHKETDRVDTGTTRLIGGVYCGCKGDCASRLSESRGRLISTGLFAAGALRGD